MPNNWSTFPLHVPVDASENWVRIKFYYDEPFKATWDLASKTFTSSVNGFVYPFYLVSRWKPV